MTLTQIIEEPQDYELDPLKRLLEIASELQAIDKQIASLAELIKLI